MQTKLTKKMNCPVYKLHKMSHIGFIFLVERGLILGVKDRNKLFLTV